MRKSVTLAGLLVALAVAGCDGASSNATPAPSATASSPTASLTPSVLTLEQAKARYLAIINPANTQLAAFKRAVDSGNLSSIRAASQAFDAAERTVTAGLLSTPWPANIAPTAQKLAEAAAAEVVLVRNFEKITTHAQLEDALSTLNASDAPGNVSTQVELMRTLLGLPKAA